jgi:hypothetical protein
MKDLALYAVSVIFGTVGAVLIGFSIERHGRLTQLALE